MLKTNEGEENGHRQSAKRAGLVEGDPQKNGTKAKGSKKTSLLVKDSSLA